MPRKLDLPDKICIHCLSPFNRRYSNGRYECRKEYEERKFCSLKCRNEYCVGERCSAYKDGYRRGHDGGYLRVSNGEYVHRLVMEKHLGRKLSTSEHVHHIDGNVRNNDISNLELVTNSTHRKLHTKSQLRNSKGRFTNAKSTN